MGSVEVLLGERGCVEPSETSRNNEMNYRYLWEDRDVSEKHRHFGKCESVSVLMNYLTDRPRTIR